MTIDARIIGVSTIGKATDLRASLVGIVLYLFIASQLVALVVFSFRNAGFYFSIAITLGSIALLLVFARLFFLVQQGPKRSIFIDD